MARSPAHMARLRRIVEDKQPTVDDLLTRAEILASVHWQIIGTVEDAVEAITHWFRAGAIDGFMAVPGGSVRSLERTLERLVPALVKAGLFRAGYSGSTLMDHLSEA